MLTHVLECPFDDNVSPAQAQNLLAKQLLTAVARIRRSLKPKRLLLLSAELLPLVDQFHNTTLGCPILPASGVFLPAPPPRKPTSKPSAPLWQLSQRPPSGAISAL